MLRNSAAVYVAQESRAVSAACSMQSVSKCNRRWTMQYTCKDSTHHLPGTEVPPLSSGKSGSGGGSLCHVPCCENSKLCGRRQSTFLGGSSAGFGNSHWATLVATEREWLRGKRASPCPAQQRRLRQRCMLGCHALGAGQDDLAECWPARALAQGQRYAIACADGAYVRKVQLIIFPAGGQAAESAAESFAASTAAAGCCWQPAGGAGGGEQADFDAHPHF